MMADPEFAKARAFTTLYVNFTTAVNLLISKGFQMNNTIGLLVESSWGKASIFNTSWY